MYRRFGSLAAVLLLSVAIGMVAWGSSHREAPLIAQDPVADGTDFYAFVSPDRPDAVNLIANYIPLEAPYGGPNFYAFGDDVKYAINVDNTADGRPDHRFEFEFRTTVRNKNTFLYNTGPVTSIDDPDLNVRQFYNLTDVVGGKRHLLGKDIPVPPVNVGLNSMPDYDKLVGEYMDAADKILNKAGTKPADMIHAFAGPRDDSFYADLRIFDLLQPKQDDKCPAVPGECEDLLAGFNVHTIAIQLPKTQVADCVGDPTCVIGAWTTSYRQSTTVLNPGKKATHGKWIQVSRLGMPLVNEVVIPRGKKNLFNSAKPSGDGQFLKYVTKPELAGLIHAIYGVDVPSSPRNDLVAVFLTGVDGLTKPQQAHARPYEALRLNLSIDPVAFDKEKPLGVLAGDVAGFPNGRRPGDDVLDIEERAVAGVLVQGFDKSPNNILGDGVDANDKPFGHSFPYLASPWPGND